jgi:SAM-dependent methyltransferase
MYWELAPWFHLVTHPKSYAGEARFITRLLKPAGGTAKPTMLELGSGGGNNAHHLKHHFEMTLTDLSPSMLALSRTINADCEHNLGDMRLMRLRRRFDFVFAHDAISYMTSEQDLARAVKTAFVHCKPGGMALFQPDDMRETFAAGRARGGHKIDGRALRYVAITRPLAKGKSEADITYLISIKERDGTQRKIEDHHTVGVFARATWLRLLRDAGFRVRIVVDPWKRVCFLATRPLRTVA